MALYPRRLYLSLAFLWEPPISPWNETTKTHLEGLTLRNKKHYAGKSLTGNPFIIERNVTVGSSSNFYVIRVSVITLPAGPTCFARGKYRTRIRPGIFEAVKHVLTFKVTMVRICTTFFNIKKSCQPAECIWFVRPLKRWWDFCICETGTGQQVTTSGWWWLS
jgi:hypothetical protein